MKKLATAEAEPKLATLIAELRRKSKEVDHIEQHIQRLCTDWEESTDQYMDLHLELHHLSPATLGAENGLQINTFSEMLEADHEAATSLWRAYQHIKEEEKKLNELETLATMAKVKSWMELGDSGVYDLAEEAEKKVQAQREALRERASAITDRREELLGEV